MKKLNKSIYITYSNQRVRALQEELSQNSSFSQVMTLDNFIQNLYFRHQVKSLFPSDLGATLIYQIIKNEQINYFDYLNIHSTSNMRIYDFIVKCKQNDTDIAQFCSGEKYNAIKQINDNYQLYKKHYNCVDIADVECFVSKNSEFLRQHLDQYSNIYIDSFQLDEISFLKSKYQVDIYATLSQFAIKVEEYKLQSKAIQYFPKYQPFDKFDEVKTALKLIRKLLDDGAKSNEVLLVCSDIKLYAPIYRVMLDEYKLKGYDSLGRSLRLLQNENKNIIKDKLSQIEKLAKRFAIKINVEVLKEKILDNSYVLDEKVGIELTEANQLIPSERGYEHIIFIGADMSKFPPKENDNFLYSQKDAQTYFYANNYYQDSLVQYQLLKTLCNHLYIISATNEGKKLLSPSMILDSNINNTFDISSIISETEGYKKREVRKSKSSSLLNYFASISTRQMTNYDGIGVENIKSKHLSASQINSYQSCPLKYLYINKHRIEAPKEESQGFDASEKGTLMHTCFEYFSKEVQGNKSIALSDAYTIMRRVLDKAYTELFIYEETTNPKPLTRNIYHDIVYSEFLKGLSGENSKSVLTKFVDYYIENCQEFNYFSNSKFEFQFALDNNLKPYYLRTSDDTSFFIKGFIDRYDDLDGCVNIIDYKSKKSNTILIQKLEDISSFKDVQLGLYMLYARQCVLNKEHNASLLTFNSDKPYLHFSKISSNNEEIPIVRNKATGVLFDEKYEEGLKTRIFEVKEKISNGEFAFNNNDESVCGYCEIKHICHHSVLHKEKNYE